MGSAHSYEIEQKKKIADYEVEQMAQKTEHLKIVDSYEVERKKTELEKEKTELEKEKTELEKEKKIAAYEVERKKTELEKEKKIAVYEVEQMAQKTEHMKIVDRYAELNKKVTYLSITFVCLFLATDWMCRGNPFVRKWLMKRYIRSNSGLSRIPPFMQRVQRENPSLNDLCTSTLPVMLLGESGTGKSTLMKRAALHYSSERMPWYRSFGPLVPPPSLKNRPVVYLSIRGVEIKDSTGKLSDVIGGIFHSVGYPKKEPFVTRFIQRMIITANFSAGMSVNVNIEIDKALNSLSDLFDVMSELKAERLKAGATEEEAKGIVFFDEIQDLIRADRLSMKGGARLFSSVADRVVSYVVNDKQFHFVVAGSSYYLNTEFEKTAACGFRWNRFVVSDMEPSIVSELLHEKGLSKADQEYVLEAFGTRLRLLEPILCLNDVNKASIEAVVAKQVEYTKSNIAKLFVKAKEQNKVINLVNALDAVAKNGKISLSYVKEFIDFIDSPDESGAIFFFALDSSFQFQHATVPYVWKKYRKELIPSSE
jgi:hypothetical protein